LFGRPGFTADALAVGLCRSAASGLAAWQRDTQHVEKSFVFGGMPARNGVDAALLIDLGATGVDDIFSVAHDRARVEDAAIIRERAKVELIPDAQLELLYPQLVAIVELKLKTGETYMQRVDAVRGTVLNPMTRDEVVAKCRDPMDPFLGATQAAELVGVILNMETINHIGSLRRLLQRF
jgi:2-methylcitrate dehydratase PrpD